MHTGNSPAMPGETAGCPPQAQAPTMHGRLMARLTVPTSYQAQAVATSWATRSHRNMALQHWVDGPTTRRVLKLLGLITTLMRSKYTKLR